MYQPKHAKKKERVLSCQNPADVSMDVRDDGVVIEMPRQRLIALFCGLLIAMLASSLDQTIISTALPTIVGDLGGADRMQWVITAEVLAMTAVMPIFGKLGDMMGRKGLYLFALVLLAAGSVIGALSTNMAMMAVGRAIQGAGGGGLVILAQALVADVIPARERGTYMGIMGVAFMLPLILGPLLGGFFTDVVSWHWAFWMNIPLAAISFVAGVLWIPRMGPQQANVRLDIAGNITLVGALVSLTVLTTFAGAEFPWASRESLVLVALTLAFSLAFVLAERHAVEPVVPLELFRNRNFVLTTLAGLLAMVALMGSLSYLPTYFQISHGLSATASGFMDLPAGISSTIAGILVGVYLSKTGRYKAMMVGSFALATASMWLLSTIGPDTSLWLIGSYLFALGFGVGLSMETLVLIAQNEFPAVMVGTVTAANNFFREVGTTLGASLVGALFAMNLKEMVSTALSSLGGAQELGIDASSITPALLAQMPPEVSQAIGAAYADALAPVFLTVVPMMVTGTLLMCFLKNTPLSKKVE